MREARRYGLTFVTAALLSVISVVYTTPLSSSMYPRALNASSTLENDEAVVLVGNAGPDTINYLQFTHNFLPAINASNITLTPGSFVAIPIPVGTKGLTLSNYTIAGRPAGYFASGMSTGYVAVNTPKIDITTRGIYYIATVLPGRRTNENFDTKPNTALLAKLKSSWPKLASLKPVNFAWPK